MSRPVDFLAAGEQNRTCRKSHAGTLSTQRQCLSSTLPRRPRSLTQKTNVNSKTCASRNSQLDELLDLIVETLQLTAAQHESASAKYHAVGDWLSRDGNDLASEEPQIYPQGSLRIGTTVRPRKTTEFDLDLVCELKGSVGFSPSQVYESIWRRMSSNGVYKPLLVSLPRCIRLDYAGDFHLDIVPAIPDGTRSEPGALLIPDRDKKIWLPSNPKGYASWFESCCALDISERRFDASIEPLRTPESTENKAPLKLAVQLFKRWRDVAFESKQELAPPSIVLTTLAARFYKKEPHVTDAMSGILGRALEWSQGNSLELHNPANPDERITDRWLATPGAASELVVQLKLLNERWRALVDRGVFPSLYEELEVIFGKRRVDRAIRKYAEKHVAARDAGELYVSLTTRSLVGSTAGSAIKIRPHNFFGGTEDE